MLQDETVEAVARSDSLETAYSVVGTGPTLVLAHGLGGSRVLWASLADALRDEFRVVSYDLRGAGRTRELRPAELTLERWADDLRALLEALGVERPVLVGHSLGASVALKHALTWPESASGLVLIGADATLSRLAERMRRSAAAIRERGLERWVAEVWSLNPPLSAASIARAPEALDLYRAMVLANDERDYVRTCEAIAAAEDLAGRLGEVRQPALVLAGAGDDRTTPEAARELARLLPRAELVEVADAAHTLPLEAPRLVAEAIARFVREHGLA